MIDVNVTCCSHLTLEYKTKPCGDGSTVRGFWVCKTCKGEFNIIAINKPDELLDVHTEHCCYRHGCKYGDTDCSVETGRKKQSHPCEECDDEAANPIRRALQSFVSAFEGDFVWEGVLVDNPDGQWTPLTRLYNEARKALDA
ncbi:MAG: hypothetical protein V3T23_00050 [Nitrososphaerales archaeon]